MQEAGVKNYDASFWFGVMLPTGAPAAIVERLNKELRAALADAEQPGAQPRAQLAAGIRRGDQSRL
jgi:tripartite-type tricarboxylate transporter receptor subunit TctC